MNMAERCIIVLVASTLILVLGIQSVLTDTELYKGLNSADGLSVTYTRNGSYLISAHREAWLASGWSFFHVNHKLYCRPDGSLSLRKVFLGSGRDSIGAWNSINYRYQADNSSIVLAIRSYPNQPVIVFEQLYENGAEGTRTGNVDGLTSAFPAFRVDEALNDLGYLAYAGVFVGETGRKIGKWAKKEAVIPSGRGGGPLVLFDRQGGAMLISPLNHFMASSPLYNRTTGQYSWGIMGNARSIPKTFSFKTILYYSKHGINKAFSDWGRVMRKYYNKHLDYMKSDLTLNYLSYWTDNGAYYVNYDTKTGLIQNRTYEDALLTVRKYAEQEQIPYKSVQYSVWFKQGKFGGDALWTANPKYVKDGMKFMFEKTGWPATAHNRWWDPDTPYAKQNGGIYDFVVEKRYALPKEEKFWIDIFRQSQQWGFRTYMQDWLDEVYNGMAITTEDVHFGRQWLLQMGEGARQNGLTIQYCMSETRHILQSLEIPAVTQARASGDYQPGNKQWRIGYTSMLADAVGIAPFKDTFWTTSDQPGNIYHGREPYPELQSAVSSLSAGPVGPGDMIGGTNRSLLMRCCSTNGLILKPSKPAMVVNDQLLQAAFGGNVGPAGEVWTTYSDIGEHRFGIIFAANLSNEYKLGPSAAGFGAKFPSSKVYTFRDLPSQKPRKFHEKRPLLLTSQCTTGQFCLYYTTPVFTFGGLELLLLGEKAKWIPMSPERVDAIWWDESDFRLSMRGAPGEEVVFHYQLGRRPGSLVCHMSPAGTATISIRRKVCTNN